MNKEQEKEYNRKYYLKNQERLLKAHNENYWDNLDRYKKYKKKYYLKNRKRILFQQKKYRALPKSKKYQREYQKEYWAKKSKALKDE